MGEYGQHPKGERFKPRFHPERLDEPAKLKKPSKIFVCSMGELFGEWVPRKWIAEVHAAMFDAPQHTFQLLTKNPKRLRNMNFDGMVWKGYTVTTDAQLWDLLYCLSDGRYLKPTVQYVSFEPLLGPIELPDWATDYIDWVIIGRMTGPGSDKHIPDIGWVDSIKGWCDEHEIPVFIKNNLGWWSRYQEFPRKT
jgi:protein gp37